jgi:ferredoxin
MACAACVTACPEEDTLKLRLSKKSKRSIPIRVYAAVLTALFVIITGIAMLTGHWKSDVTPEDYKELIHKLDSDALDHTN